MSGPADQTDDADDDGGPITAAELAAAEARWAGAEPVLRPLFARAVTGDGMTGVVLLPPDGTAPG